MISLTSLLINKNRVRVPKLWGLHPFPLELRFI